MSSPGRLVRRRSAAVSVALAVFLSVGVSGCGGDAKDGKGGKDGKAEPTKTAGVTLTPSGAKLDLGEGAKLKWVPNQNVIGLVDVAVTGILQGSAKDVAKVQITPRPENMRLYYVRLHLENLSTTNLGGVSPTTLPLHLDEGVDLLQPPASLDPKLKFDLCPSAVLPAKFGKGAEADVCLVYVATRPVERLLLQPEAGDTIEWPGTVTTPSPTPSAKKPAKKKSPAS